MGPSGAREVRVVDAAVASHARAVDDAAAGCGAAALARESKAAPLDAADRRHPPHTSNAARTRRVRRAAVLELPPLRHGRLRRCPPR